MRSQIQVRHVSKRNNRDGALKIEFQYISTISLPNVKPPFKSAAHFTGIARRVEADLSVENDAPWGRLRLSNISTRQPIIVLASAVVVARCSLEALGVEQRTQLRARDCTPGSSCPFPCLTQQLCWCQMSSR